MSDMLIVVKPPSGDALNKLMTFLVENRLEFSVRRSEPFKVSETPTSSQASENIDFSTAKNVQKKSNFEIPKITSNERISDNLVDNKLRIPQSEPIAQIKNNTATAENYDSSGNSDFPTAKKVKLEPEPEIMESEKPQIFPGAPIAHVTNMQSGDYDPGTSISGKKPLICQLCGKGIIKTTGPSRKQHAIHHLKLKTWKCIVCNRSLSHPDAGRDHFRSMHRDVPYIRLVETMSEEEKIQIDEMQIKCFPSKPIHQTRHQNDH
ncbi:hypothetical protein L3Y34_009686 [Caenorhabditis briggsae]|uniref:C2H2-type domain-containing protein n=1 Tax=Caenorhabditis briggsae TaxID=6238 RepID=A0AAE9D4J0_CAEBR|nr:hypothetical protein L3Y34_009686 [Caenorhabditis briggsae]